MLKQDIERFINLCLADVTTLTQGLEQLKHLDPNLQFADYKTRVLSLSQKAEVAAIKMRGLVAESTFSNKRLYYKAIAKTHGITITYTDDKVQIVMPFLLPSKRGHKYNCDFITDPLSYALEDFCQAHPLIKYPDCLLAFRYHYAKDFPEHAIRDHDNIEVKKVIDIITSYLLIDDSGKYCSQFFTSLPDTTEATEIYIMDKNAFPHWLAQIEHCPA